MPEILTNEEVQTMKSTFTKQFKQFLESPSARQLKVVTELARGYHLITKDYFGVK